MKFLNTIIQSLSKEEIRFYKLFVGRTNQSKERKDLKLFDIIKKSNNQDYSKKAIDKLKITSNNFYQLKTRIYNDLNNSMIWQHISKDQQSKSFSFVLLGRVHRNKGELDLAYDYFKTAEKEAVKHELYEVASIVYSEIIDLSHELVSIDLDKYLLLKQENSKLLVEIEAIDNLLAKLMYDIKTKQNFSDSDPEIKHLLNEHYTANANNKMVMDSPRFKLRLFKMYSRLLLQNKDYHKLEQYLTLSHKDFETNNLFNRANHNDKLTLLTYLTNCYYKTNTFKKSLESAELLFKAMKEYDGFLYNKYIFYYYNALVLNYAKEDKQKALDILNEAKDNTVIKKLPTYTSFIYLNTALIYYQQGKHSTAITNITRLILQEDFLSLDLVFQLKIKITELIFRSKLNQYDEINEKLKSIENDYIIQLSDKKQEREVLVLEILRKIGQQKPLDTEYYMSSIETQKNEDIVDYKEWVKTLK